ncbi:jg24506 [Pararge aegeria aegeria]|uniref:Jg24506 protein n=1 Tax=Pararge aegeria aegeria TaxID=348720 RepID=A0A8S4QZ09_9NEOP|nr:jg24506 [Pararge aegeria aegeria]
MILGNKHQRAMIQGRNPLISLNGEVLERVAVAKNLGLYIDEDLRFSEHLNIKIRNAFYKLKVLYGVRRFLTEKVRQILVESLILSSFNYCDAIYGPRLLRKTENAIQRVQNACTRFCYDLPRRSHITPVINSHKILNMKSRRNLHLTMMIYRILHGKCPPYLYEKLHWQRDNDTRRVINKWKLATPKHKKAGFRGCFRFAAAKIWNDLPPPFRTCDNILGEIVFKHKLYNLYLSLQIEAARFVYAK